MTPQVYWLFDDDTMMSLKVINFGKVITETLFFRGTPIKHTAHTVH
jgi:hypothetical protein